ncbi:MAG: sigma-54-dependent Fis family transcriptional regulator [Candidatus Cloacimonadota bacterium]|nr:MAG: sigma-54-dependent Fis family transcriptional regulator [Candidatus Cloacimonadota bacterium]
MINILVAEDKESFREYIKEVLKTGDFNVFDTENGKEVMGLFESKDIDLVLLDLRLPGKDGIAISREIKKVDSTVPIIIITAYGTVDNAVAAMKLGVYDFIEKPVDPDRLLHLVNRASREQQLLRENIILKEELSKRYGFSRIIGKSKELKEVAILAQKVARGDTTVLITGESGTGKEVFARAIHSMSPRKDNPFIAINCAAIPSELFENELFGSEKGAFTGAVKRKIGMVELADNSTLFLDEVGNIPLALQSKFLRFLQEKTFVRLGGEETHKVDVRVIAATNKELQREVKNRHFREDLYYRVSVFPIKLPPLRKRKDDILLLAEHFINKFTAELRKRKMRFEPKTKKILQNYRWPGNIRELQNIIERAVILTEGDTIHPEDIGIKESLEGIESEIEITDKMSLKEASRIGKRIAEKKLISSILLRTGGNKSKAAKILGMSYKTLLERIKEFGL